MESGGHGGGKRGWRRKEGVVEGEGGMGAGREDG